VGIAQALAEKSRNRVLQLTKCLAGNSVAEGMKHNRRIYKRGCQEHFSPSTGSAAIVRDIQSLVSYEARLILVFRPVVFWFCFVPSQRFHL
jgi:hypothetical protein